MLTHPIHPSLAFLGPIGGPEMIIILVVLFLLGGSAVLVIFLVLHFNKKNPYPSVPPTLPTGPQSTQARLTELDSLKSQNLISEAEYEEKRKQILGGL
jgi:hypothetical protein